MNPYEITFEQVRRDTIWVAKMIGWRASGTYDEVGYLAEDEDCRDFDIACIEAQPEHLRPFYTSYEAYQRKYGFTFLKDFYNVWECQMTYE